MVKFMICWNPFSHLDCYIILHIYSSTVKSIPYLELKNGKEKFRGLDSLHGYDLMILVLYMEAHYETMV